MSASSDGAPTLTDLRAVQIALSRLDDICETEPQTVIDATDQALPVLVTWTRRDAYAWALALRAKAFRFLDKLGSVLESVSTAMGSLRGDEPVAAHLHLEAGMALNQFGMKREAAGHLRDADRIFMQTGDDSGRSWALVSLAEAYADSGADEDPEPILRRALMLAQHSGDRRAERRGWKELAVLYRYRGQPAEALDAIARALEGDLTAHTRANYLLELGHLKAWLGDYAASDDAYQDAAVAYAEHGDLLGQANVERAMATNALLLGRNAQGLRRLDRAAELYRRIGSDAGLGYVLRDRCLLRLTNGDETGAADDVDEGLRRFQESADVIGLAGMLRTAAKVRHVLRDPAGTQAALGEAVTLTAAGANPLAEAGLELLQAEIGETPATRVASGMRAAELYRAMDIPAGEASALSRLARAHADAGHVGEVFPVLRETQQVLRTARGHVLDPGRRSDHDFALRDVTTDLLTTAHALGAAGIEAMADLIVDEAPLGLRGALEDGHPGQATQEFISRIQGRSVAPVGGPPQSRAHLLQQLGAILATLESGETPRWRTFAEASSAHPGQALIAFAAPTRNGHLPVAWHVPGNPTGANLVDLDADDVAQIDALGYAFEPDRTDILWRPEQADWQTRLAHVFVPPPVQDWLAGDGPRSISVLLPPVLTHVPIEALIVGDLPLGVRAAVARLVAPAAISVPSRVDDVVAYLDPDLEWPAERRTLANPTSSPEEYRSRLASNRLVVAACHGESALRAEGALVASNGERVIDAIDLLTQPLTHSVIFLEACFAGRYMGHRAGDPLSLATVGLLAGAAAVVAGHFALPADQCCTGTIAGALLHELSAGCPAPEALRRAREAYWRAPPQEIAVPGKIGMVMPGTAPWAWAGLCAHIR